MIADDFELLDLSGPLCAFTLAGKRWSPGYEVSIVSTDGGPIASTAGITIDSRPAVNMGYCDTLIVAGGPTAHEPFRQPRMPSALQALQATTRRMASVCTGAFYLAEAGLLDGRQATTHWRYAALLRSRFPEVSVEADRIFVRDGDVWTSAGISAGVDLALAMIEADLGPEASKSVAKEMVVYHRRPGGQSQFSALLEMDFGSGRIREALAFAREHLHEPLPIERLADAAHVGSRQFARIFLKETGETPARAVERLRAETAKARVEGGLEPFELIARDAGFGDVERMRRTFVKLYGHSPQALRRTSRVVSEL